MDATCNVQDSIHVFHLVHNMCPGFWVHIIVSGFYYSVRCQRLGVRFISYSYLNVTGIVAVTSILSLFIWAQNFQLNQAVYQANPFHSKFLLVLPITFLLNLPIVWGVNTLVMLLAKVEKRRYEAYLDQLEKEE